jgi:L-fucose mutarotase
MFARRRRGCREATGKAHVKPAGAGETQFFRSDIWNDIMLLGIPPVLGPDLLFTLRSMGHGDEIALVDGNYPAQDHARRLVRADGHGLLTMLTAILQVLPIDTDMPPGIFRAALNNDPAQSGPIHAAIDAACGKAGYQTLPLRGAELYPRIKATHTIVATSETALFANVILRKGVVSAPKDSGP